MSRFDKVLWGVMVVVVLVVAAAMVAVISKKSDCRDKGGIPVVTKYQTLCLDPKAVKQ